jgi:aspartokinase
MREKVSRKLLRLLREAKCACDAGELTIALYGEDNTRTRGIVSSMVSALRREGHTVLMMQIHGGKQRVSCYMLVERDKPITIPKHLVM